MSHISNIYPNARTQPIAERKNNKKKSDREGERKKSELKHRQNIIQNHDEKQRK